MTKPLKLLGMSGSLRAASYNSAALRVVKDLLPAHVTMDIADYRAVPFYDEDERVKGIPLSVSRLADQVAAADGVIIATPEYNFSVPGGLKNALDWLSRVPSPPLNGKPVAIIGASMGPVGTARVQYDLRKILVCLNAFTLNKPEIMIGSAHTRFDSEGRLTDEATKTFLASLIPAFETWIHKVS